MTPYRNLSGNAGVSAFDYGEDWISIRFSDGAIYLYTRESVGAGNLRTMTHLANAGAGLTTFINQHPEVRTSYVSRTP